MHLGKQSCLEEYIAEGKLGTTECEKALGILVFLDGM